MNDTTDLRALICDIGARAWQRGMGAANDGNVSVLLDDGTLLCTPTGVSKGFMKPEMICRIDRDGRSLDEGRWKPSTETMMHLTVYRHRPDVRAVVHAHPLYATVHAICGKPLTAQIMPESTMFLGEVPLSPYAVPASEDLSRAIAPISNATTRSCCRTTVRSATGTTCSPPGSRWRRSTTTRRWSTSPPPTAARASSRRTRSTS